MDSTSSYLFNASGFLKKDSVVVEKINFENLSAKIFDFFESSDFHWKFIENFKKPKIRKFSKNRKIKIFIENFRKSKNRKFWVFKKFRKFSPRNFQNQFSPRLLSLFSKIRMRFEATIMVHHSTSIPQHFRGPKTFYIRLYKNI